MRTGPLGLAAAGDQTEGRGFDDWKPGAFVMWRDRKESPEKIIFSPFDPQESVFQNQHSLVRWEESSGDISLKCGHSFTLGLTHSSTLWHEVGARRLVRPWAGCFFSCISPAEKGISYYVHHGALSSACLHCRRLLLLGPELTRVSCHVCAALHPCLGN